MVAGAQTPTPSSRAEAEAAELSPSGHDATFFRLCEDIDLLFSGKPEPDMDVDPFHQDTEAATILRETSALAVFDSLPIPAAVIDASALILRPNVSNDLRPEDVSHLMSDYGASTLDSATSASASDQRPFLRRSFSSNSSIASSSSSLHIDVDFDGSGSGSTSSPLGTDSATGSSSASQTYRPYPVLDTSKLNSTRVPFDQILGPRWHNDAWRSLFPQVNPMSRLSLQQSAELGKQIFLAYKDYGHRSKSQTERRSVSVMVDHLPYEIAISLLALPNSSAVIPSTKIWFMLTVQPAHATPLASAPSQSTDKTVPEHVPDPAQSMCEDFTDLSSSSEVSRRSAKRKRDPSHVNLQASHFESSAGGLLKTDPLYQVLSQSIMGRLTLEYPWHKTSLGPITTWGSELRACVSLMMQSPFRCALWVGEDLTMLYNDCYIEAAGRKHPDHIFGLAGKDAWNEIWDQIGSSALALFEGKTSYALNQLFFMEVNEHGKLSETYYSWSWIPVFDVNGKFIGGMNKSFETTERVLGERRLSTLRELALHTSRASTVDEYFEKALQALSRNVYDLPFAMCWSAHLDHKSSKTGKLSQLTPTTHWNVCHLQLKGSVGVPEGHPSAPSQLTVRVPTASLFDTSASSTSASSTTLTMNSGGRDAEIWPFKEALQSRKPIYLSELQDRTAGFEPRGWPDASTSAVIVPILGDNDLEPQAVFVFGRNPRRPWSESESQFLQLLAKQLSTGISSTRLFEEATEKAASLARLDAAKTAFFSNISHELRQPLQLILGPLEDLLQAPSDPHAKESLKMINRHAQRLLRLVNSLLDFSQLEAGRTQPKFRPIDIGAITTDLASLFRAAIERGKIVYQVDCPSVSSMCWVDIEIYEKIVFNILGNAFKYCVAGQITVQLSYSSDWAELSIRDTGSGIPESEIDRIFERFYRVEHNSSRSREGTGIGLALTAELVKIIGGQISVTSEVDVGSTFVVKLPLGTTHVPKNQLLSSVSEQEYNTMPNRLEYALSIIDEASLWNNSSSGSESTPPSATSSSSGSAESSASSIRNAIVVVVDDNRDMRNFLTHVLSRHYTCVGFGYGEDALTWLSEPGNHADLLITDRMMHRMDGMTLLRQLRSEPATALLPVIVLSAKASEEDRIEALQAGADEALGKPISSRELLAKVHNHVELGRMRIELEKKVVDRTRALGESELRSRDLAEQLGTVLRMSPCGIFASTSDGVLNYVNTAWHQITGMEGLETVNNWVLAVHPEHRDEFISRWNNAITNQTSISQFEFRWAEDRNGHPAYSQFDMQPQIAPDGSLTFIGSLTDTSNIKKYERLHVQEVEQRANDAFRMKQIAELNVDLASHEIRNPLSALYQNGELVGESLERLIEQISPFVTSNSWTPPGLNLERFVQELYDDMECIESVVLCATHLRRITDDILGWSKMNVGLLTLSKSDFHLPSQGTAIVRMLEIEAAAKEVELEITIDESVDRLNAAWVKADAHRSAQCLINFLTNGIRHTSEGPSKVKKVQVIISASEKCPERPPGAIRIDDGLESGDGKVWISAEVVDTGKGLSPEELNKLFKRFVQTNPERDSLAGYGLGLFVCKKIITLHRGFVEVSSTQGQGSSFRFVIPVERAAPQQLTEEHTGLGSTFGRALRRRRPKDASTRIVQPRTPGHFDDKKDPMLEAALKAEMDVDEAGGPITVLVVEDNLINQKVLKRQLSQRGFLPEVANNGQEALDILLKPEGKNIQVVLMDLEMPVLGGMEAVRQLREWEAKTGQNPLPVIAVTGNAREEQVQACLERGFSQVAVKPYRIAELVQQIHTLIGIAA